MKSENTLADQEARNRALDINTSFAVSAPAGSGKTGLLTQRVLALLAQAQEPENVLAITFTRKAAAEMQSRIINAITQAATENEPLDDFQKQTWQLARSVLDRDKERQWQLLECPHRLRITTIDSLCRSISERMPFDSALGAIPDILENSDTAYETASRETLKYLHKKNGLQDDLIYLVKHFDNNLENIEHLFTKLLAKRDQWLPIILQSEEQRPLLESMLEEVIITELQLAKDILAPVASELSLLADHAASNFVKPELKPKKPDSPITQCLGLDDSPTADIHSLQQWLGISELLLTQSGSLRAKPTKDIGFFAPSNSALSKEEKETAKYFKERMEALITNCKEIPGLEKQLSIVRSLPAPHYHDKQWQLLNSLTRILRHLAGELQLAFQQLGKTDYLSITLAAIDALGSAESPTDLALALDYQIQHILVDEFQDTSTTQLQLLQSLTRGWQTDDGRTLFVVGDAMQSCYRFRDANVGIFLDLREKGIGDIFLEPLDLQINFRSQSGIVHWVNEQFSTLFPKDNNSVHGAVKYTPSAAYEKTSENNTENKPVTAHLLTNDEKIDNKPDQTKHIVNIIQEHKKNNKDESIAILVRTKAHAQALISELISNNIHYRATNIDQLDTCMPVQDLLSLTRALLYPNDRMAWIALLRTPWCGLAMDDLLKIGSITEQPIITTIEQVLEANELSTTGKNKLQRFYNVIKQSLNQQYRFSLHHWVYRTWLALGGTASLIDQDDQKNTDSFFDLLAKQENGGSITQWHELEAAVEQLFAQQPAISGTPVEIMSIHKSKGLEFDTVILPYLEKSSRSLDKELITWMEKPDANNNRLLLISPIHAKGSKEDTLYEYIHNQHKDKDALETDRLLYVACTRAIKSLHLIANISTTDDGQIKTPAKGTLLNRLWDSIYESDNTVHYKQPETDTLAASNNKYETQHPNCIISLKEQWKNPEIPHNNLLQQYRGNNKLAEISDDNIAKPDALLQREKRYIGTVTHLALQQITESGYQNWNTERIEKQRSIWRCQLLQEGVNPSQLDSSLDAVIFAVTRTLKDTKGQWILDNSHTESATELEIWNNKGQHIIDRTFLEKTTDGKTVRWIIDYKTGQEKNTEEIPEEYKLQLQRYAGLFSKEEYEVRMALYFPSNTLWVEVKQHI